MSKASIELSIGFRSGRLEVISHEPGSRMYMCRCDCGKEKSVRNDHLKQAKVRSCGCLRSEVVRARFVQPASGDRFGSLVLIEKVLYHNNTRGTYKWRCKCDCGQFFDAQQIRLTKGSTTKCSTAGKHQKETKHAVGDRFGRLVITKRLESRRYKNSTDTRWLCKCDCGNIKQVSGCALYKGATKSCGCLLREVVGRPRNVFAYGEKFGNWTVVERTKGITGWSYRCVCVCGEVREVPSSRLKSGESGGCGCVARERLRHRMIALRGIMTLTSEQRKAIAKERMHADVVGLRDPYVRSRIRKNLRNDLITPELVEATKVYLKVKRQLKEKLREIA